MTTLEHELRDTLRSADWANPSPALTDHMLRRVHRARMRRRRIGTCLAVLAATTVVGVLVSQLPGGHRPATTVAAPSESCEGLTVAYLGAGTDGKDTRNLAVGLTQNSPGTRCSVSPADVAATVTVEGQRLDVTQLPPVHDSRPLELTPGRDLSVQLVWDNWCGDPTKAAQVSLAFPGGKVATTDPFQPSPECRDSAAPSTIRVFQLSLPDVSSANPASPEPVESTRVCTDRPANEPPGSPWKPGTECLRENYR